MFSKGDLRSRARRAMHYGDPGPCGRWCWIGRLAALGVVVYVVIRVLT